MQKTSTFFIGMILMVSASVKADVVVPEYQWAVDFSTEQASGDQCNGLASDRSGIYYIGGQGSPQAGGPLYYNDIKIGTGATTNSNSANANFVLVKTDYSGNMLWNITSSHGDISNNEGGIALLADGTAVAVVKVRASSGFLDEGVEFVDGTGASHKIDWNTAEEPVRSYRVMVMNINPETGAVNSIRQIVTDITPVANPGGNYTLGTPDGINVNCIATDGEYVYFGGKYRKSVTFSKESGEKVVLAPHSLESWNGDTQTQNGNIYIVKLDAAGNYVASFTVASTYNLGNALALSCNGGKLYMAGMICGMAPDCSPVDFGGVTLATYESQSPVVAAFTQDLNVQWAKLYEGTYAVNSSKSFVIQNVGILANGNDLWVSGQFNGKVINPDNREQVISSMLDTTPREGLLLHLSSADGSWIGGVASSDSYGIKVPGTTFNCIAGYFDPFVDPNDEGHVYVFGYGMNANVGVFVRRYDVETLKSDSDSDAWNMLTGGGAPTCQAMVYNPETSTFICSARGNREFNIIGTDSKVAPKNNAYGVVLSAFKMPFKPLAGVEETVGFADNDVKVFGGYGEATVTSSEEVIVEIYDITGRVAASVEVDNGSQSVALPAGLYITRYGKIVVK